MLWVDKHRPKHLDGLTHHETLTNRLTKLSQSKADLPNLLFYGPSGAGKKTRVNALLRSIYGNGVDKIKLERRVFKHPNGNKTIEVTTLSSNYHLEVNPSDVGNNDRFIIQEMIKELAQSVRIDTATPSSSNFSSSLTSSSAAANDNDSEQAQPKYKVIVLTEADRLSRAAQHALRRTMEKYVTTSRLILVCESFSKIIDPLRSRCLSIRVPSPTNLEISLILKKVAKSEGLQAPDDFLKKVSESSHRSLRKALLILEACRVQQYPFTADQTIQVPDWERYIAMLSQHLLKNQSPQA